MKFKLEFKMDNAAFDNGNSDFEIARILGDISNKFAKQDAYNDDTILDLNGNVIGTYTIEFKED